MKLLRALSFCLLACTVYAFEIDDFFDRLDNALTIAAFEGNLRARLSGTIDIEFYNFQQPAPGLIDSEIDNLFNPRLTLFLDAQFGSQIYFFAQSRFDRGFDPSDHGAQSRGTSPKLVSSIRPSTQGSASGQIRSGTLAYQQATAHIFGLKQNRRCRQDAVAAITGSLFLGRTPVSPGTTCNYRRNFTKRASKSRGWAMRIHSLTILRRNTNSRRNSSARSG